LGVADGWNQHGRCDKAAGGEQIDEESLPIHLNDLNELRGMTSWRARLSVVIDMARAQSRRGKILSTIPTR
jgi:hypothetical protein